MTQILKDISALRKSSHYATSEAHTVVISLPTLRAAVWASTRNSASHKGFCDHLRSTLNPGKAGTAVANSKEGRSWIFSQVHRVQKSELHN